MNPRLHEAERGSAVIHALIPVVIYGLAGDGRGTLDLYGHLFPDRLNDIADRLDEIVCAPNVAHSGS